VKKGLLVLSVCIVMVTAAIALFASGEDPVLSELKRLGLATGWPSAQSKERLPEAGGLTGPYWGLMKNVCKEGGYDLAAFAGKDVLFTRFSEQKKSNAVSPDVCVYSYEDKIACVFLLDSDPGVAGSMYPVQSVNKLIESYVHAESPAGYYDQPEPFYQDIVSLGPKAVNGLLKALASNDAAYARKRTGFIFMLGEIGDPGAYEALKDLFLKTQEYPARERIAISMASCLSPDRVSDYKNIIFQEFKETAEPFLIATTFNKPATENFRAVLKYKEPVAWISWFQEGDNLENTIKRCRNLSKPILG